MPPRATSHGSLCPEACPPLLRRAPPGFASHTESSSGTTGGRGSMSQHAAVCRSMGWEEPGHQLRSRLSLFGRRRGEAGGERR